MRTLTKLLLITLLLVSFGSTAGSIEQVSAKGPRMKDVFVCKANKKFVGGTVEIISSRGHLITSSHLQKRKLVIDFESVQIGTYTIRVTKGNEIEEFIFMKK